MKGDTLIILSKDSNPKVSPLPPCFSHVGPSQIAANFIPSQQYPLPRLSTLKHLLFKSCRSLLEVLRTSKGTSSTPTGLSEHNSTPHASWWQHSKMATGLALSSESHSQQRLAASPVGRAATQTEPRHKITL